MDLEAALETITMKLILSGDLERALDTIPVTIQLILRRADLDKAYEITTI